MGWSPPRTAESTVSRYQKRLSGPLIDRIDIHIEVPRVDHEKLADRRWGEASVAIQARVQAARLVQRQRFAGTKLVCSAEAVQYRPRGRG